MKLFFVSLLVFAVCLSTADAQQSLPKPLEAGEHIVFFGDSITKLGAQPGGYVSLLRERVSGLPSGGDITITGKGVGGNKVSDLLKRLDADVIELEPTRVVIFIGTNDVWHWTRPHPVTKEKREGTQATEFAAGLKSLVRQCRSADIEPIFCTPAVIGENVQEQRPEKERLDAYCDIMRTVAADQKVPLLDLRKLVTAELKKKNPKGKTKGVLTVDEVHLNAAGNAFVAASFEQFFGLKSSDPSLAPVKPPGESYDLYLLIGQSNMAGRATITGEVEAPLENCDLFDADGNWVRAGNPLNRFSSIRKSLEMQKVGPGYGFAKAMVAARPDHYVGLVVNARGGTKIQSWAKGQPYYADALTRIKAAQEHGKLKGILWHQGEGNRKDKGYLAKLTQLVKDLREDLGDPNLPFVAGQVMRECPVNSQLARIQERIERSDCVTIEGLSASDGTHFDTASQLELGKRYAEAIMALQEPAAK